MFKKFLRNKKILTYILGGIIIFLSSYFIYTNILSKENVYSLAKEASSTNSKPLKFNSKNKIEFFIKYSNCKDFIEDIQMTEMVERDKDKLNGLKEPELEEIYKSYGYKLEKFTKDQIIFIKEIEGYNYEDNSYFIGIGENNVVIYNKKQDENIAIEEPLIKNVRSEEDKAITLDYIKDKGNLMESLYKGKKEYQFKTKEEAIEYAQALCSS